MKKNISADEESRTIEMRLDHPSIYPILDELLEYYARLRHLLWRDLVVKAAPINELKSRYISEHGLLARQFNSLAKEVVGKQEALRELQALNKTDLERKIKATREKIAFLHTAIARIKLSLSQIEAYRDQCRRWKVAADSSMKRLRKPKMSAKIRGIDRVQLITKLKAKKEQVHQKKRRLAILIQKLDKLKSSEHKSICFGSKAFFKKQFNLKEAKLSSHEEWKEKFKLKRSSQAFFLGSSDETMGNQNFQYDHRKNCFKIRLPNHKAFADYGQTLEIPDSEFPEHLREEFLEALSKPGPEAKKSRKAKRPVSYRILRRFNPHTLKKAYYIQASFAISAPEVFTRRENGAIGLDINSDHLAFTETDRFGNFVQADIIPFNVKSKSSYQTEALIGDMAAVIVKRCEERHKPLVIENLDFSQKKASLREESKSLRNMLSSFAYMGIREALSSRCRKIGIEVIPINPAYTSLIAAYKFQGLRISSHKKAALAIARRGLRFSENPKVYQLTFSAQVMMQKNIYTDTKHVWKFYAEHREAIKQLMGDGSRPLLASKSILSSSSVHTTLLRSLKCEHGSKDLSLPCRRLA
jgi:IS605 OrfB family transposase